MNYNFEVNNSGISLATSKNFKIFELNRSSIESSSFSIFFKNKNQLLYVINEETSFISKITIILTSTLFIIILFVTSSVGYNFFTNNLPLISLLLSIFLLLANFYILAILLNFSEHINIKDNKNNLLAMIKPKYQLNNFLDILSPAKWILEDSSKNYVSEIIFFNNNNAVSFLKELKVTIEINQNNKICLNVFNNLKHSVIFLEKENNREIISKDYFLKIDPETDNLISVFISIVVLKRCFFEKKDIQGPYFFTN